VLDDVRRHLRGSVSGRGLRPGSEPEKARPMILPLGLRICQGTDSVVQRDRLRHRSACCSPRCRMTRTMRHAWKCSAFCTRLSANCWYQRRSSPKSAISRPAKLMPCGIVVTSSS
jgi:hypothetical protein